MTVTIKQILKETFKIKILLICLALFLSFGCKAQTIPLENLYEEYLAADKEVPDGAYIKDLNNTLQKFVGTWKATHDNKTYEFFITKKTREYLGIKEDVLLLRYLIKPQGSSNALSLEDTRALPDDHKLVVKGHYLYKDGLTYFMTYVGRAGCGQAGQLLLLAFENDNSKIDVFLGPEGDLLSEELCPNGEAEQIMPTDKVTFTKQ